MVYLIFERKSHGLFLEVRLKSGNFKPTEDAQIRENWQDYCEITGTDPEEAPAYMGCSNHKDKKRGVVYFRPWMCRGLPDRSGIQVYRRCAILFHPAHEDGGYCRPWTKKELKLLAQLGPTAKWAQIGARLNRPRFHCQKAYVNLTKGGSVDIEEKGDLKLLYSRLFS